MKGGGSLIYHCRLCATQFSAHHVPDPLVAICQVIVNGVTLFPGGNPARALIYHNCEDGRIGLAELVGAGPDDAADG